MNKTRNDQLCPRIRTSLPEEPAECLLSYKTITIGVGLLVALATLAKVTVSHDEESASETGSTDPETRLATQSLPADNSIPSTRHSRRLTSRSDFTPTSRLGAADGLASGNDWSSALGTAGPREQATAEALTRFAATGLMEELRSLDRQDVIALADHLSRELPPQRITQMLRRTLAFSADPPLTRETARSTLVDIYDALAGHRGKRARTSPLIVTDAVNQGRIVGRRHVLPAGGERIYAVFENDHAMKGLDRVFAVWRNPQDNHVVFSEFEAVNPGSSYSYVWLDVDSGWPEGHYQVELFHPDNQSQLLGAELFTIR